MVNNFSYTRRKNILLSNYLICFDYFLKYKIVLTELIFEHLLLKLFLV